MTVEAEGQKFRVRLDSGELARGRFHTQAQAEAWIADVIEKARARAAAPPTSGMRGRALAHLLTDADYYGTNERRIRAVAERQQTA